MSQPLIPPCWSRAEIQIAAQVDAGGLEYGDPLADAVFDAVHQTVPLAHETKTKARQPVTEHEVLTDLYRPLTSNEPHILFITGLAGTGKSHLVRWLRVHAPKNSDLRDNRHFVYIEKRNTSLRRIIERVLDGIDTPTAGSLRTSLARAASRVTTLDEAMLALLNNLHRLVEFDQTPAIGNLAGDDLVDIRKRVARLVGDYNFKHEFSRPGGPIERIAKLAKDGHQADADVNPDDLRLREIDLRISPEAFMDAGTDFQRKISDFVANKSLRTAAATVLDHYLPRAAAEVFTGNSVDLLHVFEDVRGELARRGKELFLFIEDLVLLHGIDEQIAQALTLPARPDLCRIRAAIAVTSGYLSDRYATFAERGVHYTMDVKRKEVDATDIRSFVGKYLNAGRVGRHGLATAARSGAELPNKCSDCVYRERCHPAFGVTGEGHGLFPFNSSAVDHLVELASPGGFDPRNILREVIRAPLEIAESELAKSGEFPSALFAAGLEPVRTAVPIEMRDAISRQSSTPDAEVSLRAFYATNPPIVDDSLRRVADVFGVHLTDLGDSEPVVETVSELLKKRAPLHEIDTWVSGGRLGNEPARKVRKWLLDAVAARLQSGPYGLNVKRGTNDLRVGSLTIRFSNVILGERSGGGGGHIPPNTPTIEFQGNDHDGVLLKGVLDAASGNLEGRNEGRWFFEVQHRLAVFAEQIIEQARQGASSEVPSALAVLGVLSSVDDRKIESPSVGLAVMIRPQRRSDLHPGIVKFLNDVDRYRGAALRLICDHLTQRKGGGAPSIFDSGVVLGRLVPSARLTALPAELCKDSILGVSLQGFDEKQRNSTGALWGPVRSRLDRISEYIGEDEKLQDTMRVMDSFVEEAHRASALTRPDAKEVYDRLRARLTDQRLGALRRLVRLTQTGSSTASLWDLASDPVPMLDDTLNYWRTCDSLLRSLREAPSTAGSPTDAYDRGRLQRALRALAATLEELTKR